MQKSVRRTERRSGTSLDNDAPQRVTFSKRDEEKDLTRDARGRAEKRSTRQTEEKPETGSSSNSSSSTDAVPVLARRPAASFWG